MTNLDTLKERLPDFARDLRINLGTVSSSTALSPAQAWTIAVACARTTRHAELVQAIEGDAPLAPDALAAARGAAAIMGMNNVYYRFAHFVDRSAALGRTADLTEAAGGDTAEYSHMPARLRMQIIGNPGIDKLDFELACLACSAITGCERCVRSHEQAVRERGGTTEMVQDAVRIAATLHGVAVALGG